MIRESGLPRGAPKQGWTRRKALFVAGSPGSGKTSLASMTAAGLGFKHVDPDVPFMHLLVLYGLDPTMPDHEAPDRYEVRGEALDIAARQRDLYMDRGLGLIVDCTGGDFGFIRRLHSELLDADYECRLILIQTSLETALRRNAGRQRKVPEKTVTAAHHAVQANLPRFLGLFGEGQVLVVDNETDAAGGNAPHIVDAYRSLLRWITG